jgi:hypothetical protein
MSWRDNNLDVIVHELMHLFFHVYFWGYCKKNGLGESQIKDIKEAFTVLINEEFKNLGFMDRGYEIHKDLRNYILKEWQKSKNFNRVLGLTIKYYKKNNI